MSAKVFQIRDVGFVLESVFKCRLACTGSATAHFNLMAHTHEVQPVKTGV